MISVNRYKRQLIFELRLRDTPPDEIGDALAQVESHVADTGEDPVDSFGPAREYATMFGRSDGAVRLWPRYVLNWLVGTLFGVVLILGISDQIRGEVGFWGFNPTIVIAIGAVGLIGHLATIYLIWAEKIRDPRKPH